ncbi:hypothetical protein V7166_21900 [Bacillus thuringiensis]
MIYIHVCKECVNKHLDVIEKKRSKGCFQMVIETDNKNECYFDYMHEEEKENE